MRKPCLDPYDRECPKTAPNYKTKMVNIGVLFKAICCQTCVMFEVCNQFRAKMMKLQEKKRWVENVLSSLFELGHLP